MVQVLLGAMAGLAALAGCAPRPPATPPVPVIQPPGSTVSPTTPPTLRVTHIAPPRPVRATASPVASASPTPPAPPATAEPADVWTSPVDGMRLRYVPQGPFGRGSAGDDIVAEPDEPPLERVFVAGFWMDETEVTQAMYRACVSAGGCSEPALPSNWLEPGYEDHPVVGVTWSQARDYCAWAGRRLPSEMEWEKAARGTDGRRYPWGWIGAPKTGRRMRANFCDLNCPFEYRDKTYDDGYAQTAPVGSYPDGASPYGLLDLAGNVWEWVEDVYDREAFRRTPLTPSPTPAQDAPRVVRGGSWAETTWNGLVIHLRAANRAFADPALGRADVGFRCALSP